MTDIAPIRRALISVSDKAGLVPFAQALVAAGVEILSTGGSAKALRDAGVPVKEVSDCWEVSPALPIEVRVREVMFVSVCMFWIPERLKMKN